MVYYSQKHVTFQVRARFRNVPGALADVLKRLADVGLNLESTSGYVEPEAEVGVLSTFGQATRGNPGREGLKRLIGGSSYVVEADVQESSEGLLFEHGTYPVVVLGGQRTVAFRQPVFQAMLSRIRTLLGEGGDLLL